jgi:hypothetical protein
MPCLGDHLRESGKPSLEGMKVEMSSDPGIHFGAKQQWLMV